MKYEYLKGSEKDFDGAPEWAIYLAKLPGHGCSAWVSGGDDHYLYVASEREFSGVFLSVSWLGGMNLIAERRPITDEQEKTLEKNRELLSDLLIPSNPNFEDAPTYRGAPITDESDLNECIGQPCDSVMRSIGSAESTGGGNADGIYAFNMKDEEFIDDFVTFGKYDRQCKGVVIDVYDVLQAFEVVNPALQHLIKKALCAGLRGHKKREQDLVEILESAKRAIELEGGK